MSGWLASQFVARDVVVVGGAVIAVVALLLSVLAVRDTGAHLLPEQSLHRPGADRARPVLCEVFAQGSYRVPMLRACS